MGQFQTPIEHQQTPRWLLFKGQEFHSYRGKKADPANEHQHGTYKEVCEQFERGEYDGLALVIDARASAIVRYEPHGSGKAANTTVKAGTAKSAPVRCVPTADDFIELPEQMVRARRWLVWKSVPNPDPKKKPGKVPHYANGAERGTGIELDSDRDVAQLATFDEALAALQTGRYTGLGFALGPDGTGNCWQGIDLDDLPNRPEIQGIADTLPGYTEKSPSGTGMHAIGYGHQFISLGSNGTGIEAYSARRFFTVTADGAGLHDPCDLSGFVETQLRPAHSRGKADQTSADGERTETIEPKTVTELRSALLSIPSDDRDVWIRMGLALKLLGNVGRGLWLEWSATSDKFDSADAAKVWRSFKPSNTGYQAVFAEAQRWGWVNPLSNAATGGARIEFSGASIVSTTPSRENAPAVDLDACVVDLNEVVSADSVHPHVIDKLVPQGEVTLLAGHGAAGKSYIALLACILTALGRSFGSLVTHRARVLFFSAEDDKAELQRRVAKICRVLQVDQSELKGWLFLMDVSEVDPTLYRVTPKGEATATSRLASLAGFVQRHDIGLTVIDNASDVFDGNEIVRTQVRAFIRTLRACLARPNRAVLLLAHVSKAAAHNRRSTMATDEDYSGSTAWHNSVRSRLSLDTDERGSSTVKHLKANKGPKADPVCLEWHEGAPTIAGTYEVPGAELFDRLRRNSEQRQDAEDKNTIVRIINECDWRNVRVPTAMQGPHSVFRVLRDVPEFPKGMTSNRLNRMLHELEREGRIFRTQRYTPSRKYVDCFTCSESVVGSAPNPPVAINRPPIVGEAVAT